MPETEMRNKLQSASGMGMIALMLIVDSTFYIFARLLQNYLPAQESTLYMMSMGTLIIVVYAMIKKRLRFRILFENLGFFMLIGFLVAVSTNLSYVAVNYIDPGTASILNQSTILLGLFWGLVWLREKLNRKQIIGAIIAIAGVVIITFQKGDYFRLGSLLVLLSSVGYSFHSAVVKKYGDHFDFLEFFSFRLICNCFFLLLWVLFTTGLQVPPAPMWPIMIVAAIVEVCISRSLYYMILRKYSVSILSIILTLSPILTFTWSFILFGTVPRWVQLFGGGVVIIGMLVITGVLGKQRKIINNAPLPEEVSHI